MLDDMIRMSELKQQGFFCSQILLMMGLEAQGKKSVDLIRAMQGLAGGLGFCGELCGALSGGACLIGLYSGKGSAEEEIDPLTDMMIWELVDWFKAEYGKQYGGISCNELLSNDADNQTTRCPIFIMGVYQKIKEILAKNGYDFNA